MPALDLRGCLEDSPKFRKRVQAHEETVQNFESSLKNLIKLARSQVNLSQEYSVRQQELAQGFLNFGQSQDDPIVAHALEKFGKSILEVEKCRNMFHAHVLNTFIEPLETFVKDNLVPIKEIRKRFEKSSDEVDTALGRYMGKKPRDPTIPESTMELADARKNFHQVYMEYVQRLNDIEAKKKVDYMENVLAYMYTESVFHHQSYEILKDLEPYMRDLTGLLHDSRQRFAEETSESQLYQNQCAQNTVAQYSPMNDNIQSVSSNSPSNSQTSIASTAKSGYLFEKRPGRVLQTWVRKYFMIEGEELTSTIRGPKTSRDDDQPTSYNLRVCSVRASDNYDRRYCFELISPSRITVLQAENEHDMHDWINCIKAASQLALNSDKAMPAVRSTGTSERNENQKVFTATNTEANMQLLKALREEPGNDVCADCGDAGPEWASTNLGVVICIECSGIHRSLGVHVSKVRSIALDKWESESIEVMLRLGNDAVNSIFEASVAVDLAPFKIQKDSSRSDRDLWITEKYVKRSFVKKDDQLDADALNQAFWDAAAQSNLPKALQYLAQGAAVDYKHPDHQLQTTLHKAVEANDEVVVEFLLQWFADVNQTDGNGWTALHYAAASNNVRLVLSLLKRHAKADAQDNNGKTALDLAVDRQNVQSVTALRLFAFDKQHNSSPASSLDFGFREAMSSFKDTNTSDRSVYSNTHSHSALDLRHASNSELAVNDKVELHDDQNRKLL